MHSNNERKKKLVLSENKVFHGEREREKNTWNNMHICSSEKLNTEQSRFDIWHGDLIIVLTCSIHFFLFFHNVYR